VHALRSIGFRGFAEGHLLGLVPAIEETMARYYDTWKADNVDGTMLNNMRLTKLVLRYRATFREMFEELTGPPPWLDKNASPSIMPYLEVIQSIWPDAAFIFTRRRPVDFIFSAINKFPERRFEHLCEVVGFTFNNWETQKARLNRFIEVDQSELYDAVVLADKLLEFLQVDRQCRPGLIENLRFQVERTANSYAPHLLTDFQLTPEMIAIFNKQCSSIMERYYYKAETAPGV
jgi:hypothetical protein